MSAPLGWSDAREIAYQLWEAEPDLDPLTLRFTELLARVCALPDFGADPGTSSEGRLEAIQMAWLEEYRDGLEPSG